MNNIVQNIIDELRSVELTDAQAEAIIDMVRKRLRSYVKVKDVVPLSSVKLHHGGSIEFRDTGDENDYRSTNEMPATIIP